MGVQVQSGKSFMRNYKRSKKPDWYENLYAKILSSTTDAYSEMVGEHKAKLFAQLDESMATILEIGIGTGANFQYFTGRKNLKIIGVDPNLKMKKYVIASLSDAGISDSQFEFIHGVSESLPLENASVDAVISTLSLCSVTNVPAALKEIQRVLKPGGCFIFIEHVAAREGSWLKFFQKLVNPFQMLIADGCQFTIDILKHIEDAGFDSVDASSVTIPMWIPFTSPHTMGIARKA